MQKQTTTPNTRAMTKNSNRRNPHMDPLGRQKRSRTKTSTNVMAHPATKGIAPCESRFRAIADPTT